ncbi:Ppx/GppA phosphatase family protein [Guggenheimella bovis]
MKAIIDCGSNSVRLLLFDTKEDFLKGIDRTEITRLGKGVKETGLLSKESMEETFRVLSEYEEIIKEKGVDTVEVFCTEAVRTAKNGEAFKDEVMDRFHWNVRIISGEEEAEAGFLGAKLQDDHDHITLVDIGGASTEIIMGTNEVEYRKSFPIGALKYTENPDTSLDEVFEGLPLLKEPLIGIGGTITSSLSMDLELEKYERKLIQGKPLKRERIDAWVQKLEKMSLEEIEALPGLDKKRAPIILHGLKILQYLLKRTELSEVIVSDYGNLEGYAVMRELC